MSNIYENLFNAKVKITENKNDLFNLLNDLDINTEKFAGKTSKVEERKQRQKARIKAYCQRPEVKAMRRECVRRYSAKFTKEEKSKKWHEKYDNLTEEQKEELRAKHRKWLATLSDEERKAMYKRHKQNGKARFDAMTEEEKEKIREKKRIYFREHKKRKLNAMTEEERKEQRKKACEKTKKYYARMTEEQKEKRRAKARERYQKNKRRKENETK